jgi:PEP-CTERM motif-containing protein
MTHFKKMTFLMTIALAAALAGKATAAETATTSISGSPIVGGFQYDISVTNTSTDGSTIGTLWFSWVPGFFYMEATPTDVGNSAGWENNIIAGGGESIQWEAESQPLLTPGNTDQFTFDSTEPISQLEGASTEGNKAIETTSFLYSGNAAFNGTGVEIVIPAAVPEPATLSLLGLSAGGLLLRRRRAA